MQTLQAPPVLGALGPLELSGGGHHCPPHPDEGWHCGTSPLQNGGLLFLICVSPRELVVPRQAGFGNSGIPKCEVGRCRESREFGGCPSIVIFCASHILISVVITPKY